MDYLMRMGLTVVTAAVMAIIGIAALSLTDHRSFDGSIVRPVAIFSILFWTILAPPIAQLPIPFALSMGLFSPFLLGLTMFGPFGPIVVLMNAPACCGVGLTAGLLIWLIWQPDFSIFEP